MKDSADNRAAPMAMKTARRASAAMIPKTSTRCRCSRGTANVAMMITKTKRLSTDRLFSTRYPAKY
jgi:hypothetical protein